MRVSSADTIIAVATAHGTGAMAVVRLSGANAVELVDRVFVGARRLRGAEARRAFLGTIREKDRRGSVIDEVVVTLYRAPSSYTGENVVEISCHGGVFVTKRILELFIHLGARLAEPGEFTRRAFINGRIDLAQAEAVCDVIQARTELARRSSIAQLQGSLSSRIQQLHDRMIELRSLLELELDFAEEDVEIVAHATVRDRIESMKNEITTLIDNYQQGHFFRDGVRLVIAGRPNVGKSSLLNALLRTDRAIVTDIPGTTRDAIEEALDIEGMLFRIIDTAGLRQTSNVIEAEGVRRTKKYLASADVVLAVFDGSEPLSDDDREVLNTLDVGGRGRRNSTPPAIIFVINKIDLPKAWRREEIDRGSENDVLEISVKERVGIESLEKRLLETVLHGKEIIPEDYLITNVRHWQALMETQRYLQLAMRSVDDGLSAEFIALDLRAASDGLGKITGTVSSEEILHHIFANFCIGK